MPVPMRPPRLPRPKTSAKAGSKTKRQSSTVEAAAKEFDRRTKRPAGPKGSMTAGKAMQILWFVDTAIWMMVEAIRLWVDEVLLDPDYDVHTKFENSVTAYLRSGSALQVNGRWQIPLDIFEFDFIPFSGDNFWHNWAGSVAAVLTILTGQRGHSWGFVSMAPNIDFVHPTSGFTMFKLDFVKKDGVVVTTELGKLTEKLAATASLDELITSTVSGITLADGVMYVKQFWVDSPILNSVGPGDTQAAQKSGSEDRAARGVSSFRAPQSEADAQAVLRAIRDASDFDGVIDVN